jgi:DNA mismatch endonuclease (patch repair protein)
VGLRYRLYYKIVGRPDIVFPKARVAVFVDGCFWHGCPEHGVSPATNSRFWGEKIEKNITRDRHVAIELESAGWLVMRFWEHDVTRASAKVAAEVARIVGARRAAERRPISKIM